MSTKELLSFIELIGRETRAYSAELSGIFGKTLDADEKVRDLKFLLENCSYYGEIGGSIRQRAYDTLGRLYSEPDEAVSLLDRVRHECDQISGAADASIDLLKSPEPFNEPLTVLRSKDKECAAEALKTVAKACVYLLLVYGGPAKIRNLIWNDEAGIQEKAYSVNTRFLPALLSAERPSYCWVIYRMRSEGDSLIEGDCFFMQMEELSAVKQYCSMFRCEKLSEYIYLNPDEYEKRREGEPLCWGIGNFTSVSPFNALDCLQKDLVTGMRAPRGNELSSEMPRPDKCLEMLADGREFCIAPDSLLTALNQWQMGYDIDAKNRAGKCLICGRRLKDRKYACASHFTNELR